MRFGTQNSNAAFGMRQSHKYLRRRPPHEYLEHQPPAKFPPGSLPFLLSALGVSCCSCTMHGTIAPLYIISTQFPNDCRIFKKKGHVGSWAVCSRGVPAGAILAGWVEGSRELPPGPGCNCSATDRRAPVQPPWASCHRGAPAGATLAARELENDLSRVTQSTAHPAGTTGQL